MMILKMKLPWYISLLGSSYETEEFSSLCLEFDLSSDDVLEASTRWYENRYMGISVYIQNGLVNVIQFFSNDHTDFEGRVNELPFGLDFGMKKEEVYNKFGKPDNIIEGRTISSNLGHSGIYRYYVNNFTIAITFSKNSEELEVLSFESLEIKDE